VWSEPKPNAEFGVINYEKMKDIFVPEQYGELEISNTESPSGTAKRLSQIPNTSQVILIKDAHCNYEAQTNIAKILEILVRDYGIKLVCVEGAEGEVNTKVFQSFPYKDIREETSKKFIKKGILSASEALSITKADELPFNIWGIEGLKLYVEDLRAFRETLGNVNEAEFFIKNLNNIIALLKKRIYPAELLEFDDRMNLYNENKIGLTEWVEYIKSKIKNQKSKSRNFYLVLRAINIEKEIDFNKVEAERTGLIRDLEKVLVKEDLQELVQKSILFKLGKVPALVYYTYLERLSGNLRLKNYNLHRYIHVLKLQSKIDSDLLFKEMSEMEEEVFSGYFSSKIIQDLYYLSKDCNVLDKLFHLVMSRDGLAYYRNNKEKFSANRFISWITPQCAVNNITLPNEFKDEVFLGKVDSFMGPADRFYELALERDEVLVSNLLNKMQSDNRNNAVVVAGGFHADGIKEKLEKKGVDCITITPKITKTQEDCPYLSLMTDDKLDIDSLVKNIQSNIPVPLANSSQAGNSAFLREARQDMARNLFDLLKSMKGKSIKDAQRIIQQQNKELAGSFDALIGLAGQNFQEGRTVDDLLNAIKPENIMKTISGYTDEYIELHGGRTFAETEIERFKLAVAVAIGDELKMLTDLRDGAKSDVLKNLIGEGLARLTADIAHAEGMQMLDGRKGLWVNDETNISNEDAMKNYKRSVLAREEINETLVEGGMLRFVVDANGLVGREQRALIIANFIKQVQSLNHEARNRLINLQKMRDAEGLGPILITVLKDSMFLSEDHLANGFIGINHRVFTLEDKDAVDALVDIGLGHELRHEALVYEVEHARRGEGFEDDIDILANSNDLELIKAARARIIDEARNRDGVVNIEMNQLDVDVRSAREYGLQNKLDLLRNILNPSALMIIRLSREEYNLNLPQMNFQYLPIIQENIIENFDIQGMLNDFNDFEELDLEVFLNVLGVRIDTSLFIMQKRKRQELKQYENNIKSKMFKAFKERLGVFNKSFSKEMLIKILSIKPEDYIDEKSTSQIIEDIIDKLLQNGIIEKSKNDEIYYFKKEPVASELKGVFKRNEISNIRRLYKLSLMSEGFIDEVCLTLYDLSGQKSEDDFNPDNMEGLAYGVLKFMEDMRLKGLPFFTATQCVLYAFGNHIKTGDDLDINKEGTIANGILRFAEHFGGEKAVFDTLLPNLSRFVISGEDLLPDKEGTLAYTWELFVIKTQQEPTGNISAPFSNLKERDLGEFDLGREGSLAYRLFYMEEKVGKNKERILGMLGQLASIDFFALDDWESILVKWEKHFDDFDAFARKVIPFFINHPDVFDQESAKAFLMEILTSYSSSYVVTLELVCESRFLNAEYASIHKMLLNPSISLDKRMKILDEISVFVVLTEGVREKEFVHANIFEFLIKYFSGRDIFQLLFRSLFRVFAWIYKQYYKIKAIIKGKIKEKQQVVQELIPDLVKSLNVYIAAADLAQVHSSVKEFMKLYIKEVVYGDMNSEKEIPMELLEDKDFFEKLVTLMRIYTLLDQQTFDEAQLMRERIRDVLIFMNEATGSVRERVIAVRKHILGLRDTAIPKKIDISLVRLDLLTAEEIEFFNKCYDKDTGKLDEESVEKRIDSEKLVSLLRKMDYPLMKRRGNMEEVNALVEKGYDRRLWSEGVTVHEDCYVNGKEEDVVMYMQKAYGELLDITGELGIDEIETENEFGEKVRVSADLATLQSKVKPDELEAYALLLVRAIGEKTDSYKARIQDIRAGVKAYLSQLQVSGSAKKKNFYAVMEKDFFGEATCGKGVPGCFAPNGIHKEMPVMHAFEANTFMVRVYDSETHKQVANVVVTLTDQGAIVYSAYKSTGFDLDPLFAKLWTSLVKAGMVPKVIVQEGKAGYSKLLSHGRRHQLYRAERRRTIWDDVYHDFGPAENGRISYELPNALEIAPDTIQAEESTKSKENIKVEDMVLDVLGGELKNNGLGRYGFISGELRKPGVDIFAMKKADFLKFVSADRLKISQVQLESDIEHIIAIIKDLRKRSEKLLASQREDGFAFAQSALPSQADRLRYNEGGDIVDVTDAKLIKTMQDFLVSIGYTGEFFIFEGGNDLVVKKGERLGIHVYFAKKISEFVSKKKAIPLEGMRILIQIGIMYINEKGSIEKGQEMNWLVSRIISSMAGDPFKIQEAIKALANENCIPQRLSDIIKNIDISQMQITIGEEKADWDSIRDNIMELESQVWGGEESLTEAEMKESVERAQERGLFITAKDSKGKIIGYVLGRPHNEYTLAEKDRVFLSGGNWKLFQSREPINEDQCFHLEIHGYINERIGNQLMKVFYEAVMKKGFTHITEVKGEDEVIDEKKVISKKTISHGKYEYNLEFVEYSIDADSLADKGETKGGLMGKYEVVGEPRFNESVSGGVLGQVVVKLRNLETGKIEEVKLDAEVKKSDEIRAKLLKLKEEASDQFAKAFIDKLLVLLPNKFIVLSDNAYGILGVSGVSIKSSVWKRLTGKGNEYTIALGDVLSDDPVAVFHELAEQYLAKADVFSELVSKRIHERISKSGERSMFAHTFLRGCGEKLRAYLRVWQEGGNSLIDDVSMRNFEAFCENEYGYKISEREKILISANLEKGSQGEEALWGLQDRYFAQKNADLTLKIKGKKGAAAVASSKVKQFLYGERVDKDNIFKLLLNLAEQQRGIPVASDEVRVTLYRTKVEVHDPNNEYSFQRNERDLGFPVLLSNVYVADRQDYTKYKILTPEEIAERFGLEVVRDSEGKPVTVNAKTAERHGRMFFLNQDVTVVISKDGKVKDTYFGILSEDSVKNLEETDRIVYGTALEFKGGGTDSCSGVWAERSFTEKLPDEVEIINSITDQIKGAIKDVMIVEALRTGIPPKYLWEPVWAEANGVNHEFGFNYEGPSYKEYYEAESKFQTAGFQGYFERWKESKGGEIAGDAYRNSDDFKDYYDRWNLRNKYTYRYKNKSDDYKRSKAFEEYIREKAFYEYLSSIGKSLEQYISENSEEIKDATFKAYLYGDISNLENYVLLKKVFPEWTETIGHGMFLGLRYQKVVTDEPGTVEYWSEHRAKENEDKFLRNGGVPNVISLDYVPLDVRENPEPQDRGTYGSANHGTVVRIRVGSIKRIYEADDTTNPLDKAISLVKALQGKRDELLYNIGRNVRAYLLSELVFFHEEFSVGKDICCFGGQADHGEMRRFEDRDEDMKMMFRQFIGLLIGIQGKYDVVNEKQKILNAEARQIQRMDLYAKFLMALFDGNISIVNSLLPQMKVIIDTHTDNVDQGIKECAVLLHSFWKEQWPSETSQKTDLAEELLSQNSFGESLVLVITNEGRLRYLSEEEYLKAESEKQARKLDLRMYESLRNRRIGVLLDEIVNSSEYKTNDNYQERVANMKSEIIMQNLNNGNISNAEYVYNQIIAMYDSGFLKSAGIDIDELSNAIQVYKIFMDVQNLIARGSLELARNKLADMAPLIVKIIDVLEQKSAEKHAEVDRWIGGHYVIKDYNSAIKTLYEILYEWETSVESTDVVLEAERIIEEALSSRDIESAKSSLMKMAERGVSKEFIELAIDIVVYDVARGDSNSAKEKLTAMKVNAELKQIFPVFADILSQLKQMMEMKQRDEKIDENIARAQVSGLVPESAAKGILNAEEIRQKVQKNPKASVVAEIAEFPGLVFKVASDQERNKFDEQVEKMWKIAKAIGYEFIFIDGYVLIKIEGFTPFSYANGVIVLQKTKTVSEQYPNKDAEGIRKIVKRIAADMGKIYGMEGVQIREEDIGFIKGKPVFSGIGRIAAIDALGRANRIKDSDRLFLQPKAPAASYFGEEGQEQINPQVKSIMSDETGKDFYCMYGKSDGGAQGNLNETEKYRGLIDAARNELVKENPDLLGYDIVVLRGVNFSGHYGISRKRIYIPLEILEAFNFEPLSSGALLQDFIRHEFLESTGLSHDETMMRCNAELNQKARMLYRRYVVTKILDGIEGQKGLKRKIAMILKGNGSIQDPKELLLTIEKGKRFELAPKIVRLVDLLSDEDYAKDRGRKVLLIEQAILNAMPAKIVAEVTKEYGLKESDVEEKILRAAVELGKRRGIDPKEIQSIFDLFKQGMDLLTMYPELDKGEVDEAYFNLIAEIEKVTEIKSGTIMTAFGRKYEIKAKITDGQPVQGSVLDKQARLLGAYNGIWDDVKSMAAVVPDAAKEKLDNTVVVFHVGAFSNMPLVGLRSVLNNLKGQNIKLGIRVPKGKEGEVKAFLDQFWDLKENIILLPEGIEEASGQLSGKYKNISFVAGEEDAKKLPKGSKVFNIDSASSFHAVFLFGVVYAATDDTKEIGAFLKNIGIPDDEVKDILDKISKQEFFTVKLIRIKDVLQEFQNRRKTIEIAA
jgi:hypothetical protein